MTAETTEAPGMPETIWVNWGADWSGNDILRVNEKGSVIVEQHSYTLTSVHTAALAERDAEIKKLREELEYYGDPDNWHGFDWLPGDDQGHRARAALSAEKEGE